MGGTRTSTREGSRNLFDTGMKPRAAPRTSERKFRNRPNLINTNTINQNAYNSNTFDPMSGTIAQRTVDRLGPATAGSTAAMERESNIPEDITDQDVEVSTQPTGAGHRLVNTLGHKNKGNID